MRNVVNVTQAEDAIQQWPRKLTAYREPCTARSLVELAATLFPLLVIWAAMWASLHLSAWLCLALSVPASGFLVRLFMIQHDCSHGAFFRSRWANDWTGRAIGILTLTPHDVWRRTHAMHHAGTGNLDRRGIGDVATMTVGEYLDGGYRKRMLYRVYRHPAVLFGLGPAYLFLLQQRLPLGLMRGGWQPWISAMATNFGIAALATLLVATLGVAPLLLILLPSALLAASVGVWLFYVQHQFEHTYWAPGATWEHPEASLRGSSHYDLPIVLRWFTANIGVHHVHHLSSRIPFYRLPEVLRDHPELVGIGRLSFRQSLGCVRLSLWDERRCRLVSFREMWANIAAERDAGTASAQL